MQITVTITVVVIVKIFNKNANLVAVTVLAILNQKKEIKLRSKAKLVARIAIRRTIAKKMQVKVVLQLQINPPEVAIIVGQKVFVLWATKQRTVQKEAVVAEKARHLVHEGIQLAVELAELRSSAAFDRFFKAATRRARPLDAGLQRAWGSCLTMVLHGKCSAVC